MRTFTLGALLGALIVIAIPAVVQRLVGAGVAASPGPTPYGSRAATTAGLAAQIAAVDRALAQAGQTRRAVPVTLVFSDRDLTSAAAAYFPQSMSGVTLADPVVHVRGGQIVLDTTASAAFLRGTAAVAATVGVASGRPATTIVSATIGGAALPASVASDIKTQLDRALAAGLPAKFDVTGVTAGDGALTVTGIANP